MSKIDLLDQQWIDLVFEGKNEAYGAYQLRKQTNQRNLWAFLCLIAGIAGIVAFFLLYGVAKNALEADVEVESAVEVEAATTDEQAAEEEEEVEVVYEEMPEPEQQVLEEELVQSERFTEISTDDEKPQEVAKANEDANKSEKASGSMDSDVGQEEAGQLRKEEDKIVEEKTDEDNTVYQVTMIEQMPLFPGDAPGSQVELLKFLGKNTRYPPRAEEMGIKGRVTCQFTVERDGSITDVKVVRGVDPDLDREAVRVIKSMPKWIPGKQNGRSVRVRYTCPINFTLQ